MMKLSEIIAGSTKFPLSGKECVPSQQGQALNDKTPTQPHQNELSLISFPPESDKSET